VHRLELAGANVKALAVLGRVRSTLIDTSCATEGFSSFLGEESGVKESVRERLLLEEYDEATLQSAMQCQITPNLLAFLHEIGYSREEIESIHGVFRDYSTTEHGPVRLMNLESFETCMREVYGAAKEIEYAQIFRTCAALGNNGGIPPEEGTYLFEPEFFVCIAIGDPSNNRDTVKEPMYFKTRLELIFRLFDVNGDGLLSYEECYDMFEALMTAAGQDTSVAEVYRLLRRITVFGKDQEATIDMETFVEACWKGALAKHGLFTSHIWRFNALPESPLGKKRKAPSQLSRTAATEGTQSSRGAM